MAYRDSTSGVGNSEFPTTAVPAGVVADDIVILFTTMDALAQDFTGTYPAGFLELFSGTVTLDGQVISVSWKRLTGADSGSYTFGDTGNPVPWVCQAFAFSGRDTGNPPVLTSAVSNAGNTSPVSVNATGLTAVQGDDLLWLSAPDINTSDAGIGHAAPGSYTEVEDATNTFADAAGAVRENVSAGATGTVTGTFTMSSGTSGWAAFLVRIPTGAVPSAAAFEPSFRKFPKPRLRTQSIPVQAG